MRLETTYQNNTNNFNDKCLVKLSVQMRRTSMGETSYSRSIRRSKMRLETPYQNNTNNLNNYQIVTDTTHLK